MMKAVPLPHLSQKWNLLKMLHQKPGIPHPDTTKPAKNLMCFYPALKLQLDLDLEFYFSIPLCTGIGIHHQFSGQIFLPLLLSPALCFELLEKFRQESEQSLRLT